MKKMCEKYWTGVGNKYLLSCQRRIKSNTKRNEEFEISKVSYFDINETLLDQNSVLGPLSCPVKIAEESPSSTYYGRIDYLK